MLESSLGDAATAGVTDEPVIWVISGVEGKRFDGVAMRSEQKTETSDAPVAATMSSRIALMGTMDAIPLIRRQPMIYPQSRPSCATQAPEVPVTSIVSCVLYEW